MKFRWEVIIILIVISVPFFLFCYEESRDSLMVNCDATVSLDYRDATFRGNYFFALRNGGTGTVSISGHVVSNGQSSDVLRTFKVMLEPLNREESLYRLTVVHNTLYSSDAIAPDDHNWLASWAVSSARTIENTALILHFQPVGPGKDTFLISNLKSPVMLCQPVKME